ncbi:hypothetical protein THIOSC15_2100008 [uncultured Thiomicrorhabdus sp.]
MTTNETFYHHDDEHGNETTFCVKFNFTPGDPGRLTGPMEKCYPPTEAELEITGVYLHSTSTPGSREHKRFHGNLMETTSTHRIRRLMKETNLPTSNQATWPMIRRLFHLLNSGGWIGPEQYHPPTDFMDILSKETMDKIEATCWEHLEFLASEEDARIEDYEDRYREDEFWEEY